MIKRLDIEKFKRFSDSKIDLKPKHLSIVVGGNNSGKSSLLQALALWNYAKSVIIFFKGRDALDQISKKEGSGISFDDFTPLNIPSFDYLWTNLSAVGGYTLKIKVLWDDAAGQEKFLQLAFSLVQDRLYTKKFDSNLISSDPTPEIAYLPPFAGITEKEPWMSNADRRKQIGRGLSGSVLRNLIYDFYKEYEKDIEPIKSISKKKQPEERKKIWDKTSFGKINNILAEVFSVQLFPEEFSQEFHNYLRIPIKKGAWSDSKFVPHSAYSARDIMAEGRGFLQWLSTFCLLYDQKINVLLLDEPDAHLHATLQTELINYLETSIQENGKQILIATHSSEVIKSVRPSKIISVDQSSAKYCNTDSQVQKILLGIGVEHFPFLHRVQLNKKVIFVESKFDEEVIKDFSIILRVTIPDTIVFWPIANNHKERKQVFLHLKNQLPGFKVISLEDRDNIEYSTTNDDLSDRSFPDIIETTPAPNAFLARRWRRWELESYLINPAAIAGTASRNVSEIENDLLNEFSMRWPIDFKQSQRSNSNASLFDRDGKTIIEWFERKYSISKYAISKNFSSSDVPDDISILINQILSL